MKGESADLPGISEGLPRTLEERIKGLGLAVGFDLVGIAEAVPSHTLISTGYRGDGPNTRYTMAISGEKSCQR